MTSDKHPSDNALSRRRTEPPGQGLGAGRLVLSTLAAMPICGVGTYVAAVWVMGCLGTCLHGNYEYYGSYLSLCEGLSLVGFLAPVLAVGLWLIFFGSRPSRGGE
jgi:hypothetical protein